MLDGVELETGVRGACGGRLSCRSGWDVAEAVEDVQAGGQERRPVRDVLVGEEGGAVSGGEEGG